LVERIWVHGKENSVERTSRSKCATGIRGARVSQGTYYRYKVRGSHSICVHIFCSRRAVIIHGYIG
jgi:hypothetical protein